MVYLALILFGILRISRKRNFFQQRFLTKFFCKCLEYISKRVRFYKATTLQRIMFTKRSISSEGNFNGHAKILITHILYRNTTPEAYLEPSRTSTRERFCKKTPSAIFSKTFHPRCSTGF